MLCYQPNIASAQWGHLRISREALINRGLLDVVPNRWDPGSISFDKRGKGSFHGGPALTFLQEFKYRTKDGDWLTQNTSSVFTFTSKMSCPSFGIPAGTGQCMGSCEGSSRKSVEAEGSYKKFHRPLVSSDRYICSFCYAGKSYYSMYPSNSISQLVRNKWALDSVSCGSFVDQMVKAIEHIQTKKSREILSKKNVSPDYFRIHDAGDFFSPQYYKAWVEVVRRLPKVYFWAPTRLWPFEKWMKVFKDTPPPPNLALRPSALCFGAAAPAIQGFAQGTTSVEVPKNSRQRILNVGGVNTWNCPAYMSDSDEKSCQKVGCRVCWRRPEMPVNYRSH